MTAPALRRAAVVLLSFLAIACGRRDATPLRAPLAGASSSFVLDRDRVRHEGILIPAGSELTWDIRNAAAGRLRFAWTAKTGGAVTLRVADGHSVIRTFRAPAPEADVYYEDIAWDGDTPLRFSANRRADVLISDLRIVHPSDTNDAVIVILVDTLRRDAVGLYGSRRSTTPQLDRILLGAWKAERAYAPASWTMPSVASLLTGMQPEVLEDDKGAPVGIAEDVPTIGYDFARAGWATAHFNANPTLNVDSGFHRGFTTFYTPPYDAASMLLPGSEVMRRVPKWLRAHEGEKFFLYLQLIDPHEPYGAPGRPKGTTPFDPGYTGRYTGDESHYSLTFDKAITPRDIEHLRALYDDDVRYTDTLIGRFWEGLGLALRTRATLVLLSDHGEEFFEHRGWKHGPSLYDEVLAVPLVIRAGNGRRFPAIPADTLISLTDFLPTLVKFFGIDPDRKLNGIDLAQPKAWERDQLPAIHMLTGGAARAAVVRKDGKLLFFDRLGVRGVPDRASDPTGYDVAMHLREILPPLTRFDLSHDSGETRPQPPISPTKGREWRSIEESLAHTRRGIEVRVLGGNAAQRVRISIDVVNGGTESFGGELEDGIEATSAGLRAALDLTPGDVDGFLIRTADDAVPAITLLEGCAKLNGTAMTVGAPVATTRVTAGIPRLDVAPRCASIYVWRSAGERYFRSKAEEDEARKKLRAIGYIH